MGSCSRFLYIFLGSAWLLASGSVAAQTSEKANKAACTLCFYGPDNLVFDARGNAYITDNDHKSRFRVLKVSPQGEQLGEWRVFAAVSGRRSGPEGVAIDSSGNVLVTDGGGLRILKLSPTGKLLMTIGGTTPLFHDLGHVAVDSAGYIYVSEGGQDRIQKFSSVGKKVTGWKGVMGSGAGAWKMPETIATRSDGSLVVEDWGNRRIVVLSSDGKTRFVFGGPSQFENSSGLCVDHEGNVYVSDEKLHRVDKFTSRGKLLSTISNSGGDVLFSEGPGSIATDAQDNLYASDGLSIVKFSPQGRLLARWR